MHLVGRHRRGRRAKRESIRSLKETSISSSFHAAPSAMAPYLFSPTPDIEYQELCRSTAGYTDLVKILRRRSWLRRSC